MYNELVEERLSQLTKAFKINKLEEDKETLTKELRKWGPLPQRLNKRTEKGVVKAKEQKNNPSASSSSAPRDLKDILSPETVNNLWPKDLGDENDSSAPSLGDVTPTSSNGSMQPANKSWDAYMAVFSGADKIH